MVQAVRYVHEARISRGMGDLDWLSEVDDIKPDIFFVNEDGDRPAKREACARLGIKSVFTHTARTRAWLAGCGPRLACVVSFAANCDGGVFGGE